MISSACCLEIHVYFLTANIEPTTLIEGKQEMRSVQPGSKFDEIGGFQACCTLYRFHVHRSTVSWDSLITGIHRKRKRVNLRISFGLSLTSNLQYAKSMQTICKKNRFFSLILNSSDTDALDDSRPVLKSQNICFWRAGNEIQKSPFLTTRRPEHH